MQSPWVLPDVLPDLSSSSSPCLQCGSDLPSSLPLVSIEDVCPDRSLPSPKCSSGLPSSLPEVSMDVCVDDGDTWKSILGCSLANFACSLAKRLTEMDSQMVSAALQRSDSCTSLLDSLGIPGHTFLSYLSVRKLQTVGLAQGPLQHIGWGARAEAAKLLGST